MKFKAKKFVNHRNTGKIINKKHTGKTGNYTCISNNISQSKTMTANQIRLLVYLLSKPPDWVIYKRSVYKQIKMGRDACIKAFNELVNLGFITEEPRLVNNMKTYHYTVYEEPPSGVLETSNTEKQSDRDPVCIQSNKLKSNNLQSINKENNNINIGANMLGPVKIYKTEKIDSLFQKVSEIVNDLSSATSLGKNISKFIFKNDLAGLELKIGKEELQKIMGQIEKFQIAQREYKSASNDHQKSTRPHQIKSGTK
jgi:hypothetical protein